MDHKAGNQLPHGWMMGFSTVQVEKVSFGELELNNVRASVVRSQKAPLLLGQSVLSRLGKIEIDNPGRVLKITHRK